MRENPAWRCFAVTNWTRWTLAVALAGAALGLTGVPLASARPTADDGVVLFVGDSLTAGYGIDSTLAFPALVQGFITDRGWPYRVVNAGVSGETTTGGLGRIDWLLRQEVDVLVLELGANDGLRGTDLSLTERNLQAIIERVRNKYPAVEIVLAGMLVPPNLGSQYATAFRAMYPRLAAANDTHLIPFLLADVGGVAELNLADGIHPNAEGHRRVAGNVWAVLGPILAEIGGR